MRSMRSFSSASSQLICGRNSTPQIKSESAGENCYLLFHFFIKSWEVNRAELWENGVPLRECEFIIFYFNVSGLSRVKINLKILKGAKKS